MCWRFSGALAYAADIALLSLRRSGLIALIEQCEKYADEFNITFMSVRKVIITQAKEVNVNNKLDSLTDSAVYAGQFLLRIIVKSDTNSYI